MTITASIKDAAVCQLCEKQRFINGGMYTITFLSASGNLVQHSFNINMTNIGWVPIGEGEIDSFLYYVTHYYDGTTVNFAFCSNSSQNQTVSLIAVKLELGSQQTLAHKEDGVWVLNEILDYGEQLRRCQRYAQNGYFYTVIGQLTYAGTAYVIPLRFLQDMRATPAITVKEISAYGWGNVPISSAEIIWNTKYGAFVAITDLSTKDNYIGKACYVYYFASADL